jgi:tripartite-type tricarboxylate transporter receptor subunit TctC
MRRSRPSAGAGIAVFAMATWITCAQAQDYPTHEIRMVNGYAAGAGADVTSRIFARYLEETLGKPVFVENKPGAFTNIGAESVARSKPDGYTMFFAGHSTIAMNVFLFKTLPFDPVKDFFNLAPAGKVGFGFAVGPQSPAKSIAELTAYLKRKGDKATYAYANTYGLAATELYKQITGAPALGVPYKSAGDALNAVARGDVDFLIYDLGSLTEQEAGGRLRVLAVTTAERSSIRTDLPGMREAGVPDFDLPAWFGIWLPANPPRPVVGQLATAIRQIWDRPDMVRALRVQTVEPFIATPEEFDHFVKAETAKWGRVMAIAKIEPQ